ncbi:hypothetical protein BH10ACI3_BH10ACI3_14200 [soil metagenome]
MNKYPFVFLLAISIYLSTGLTVFSQLPSGGKIANPEWICVQSDDGEFSVDVPSEYRYFASAVEFVVAKNEKRSKLQNLKMLNSYFGGTLLSFEIYDGTKEGLDTIFEDDKDKGKSSDKIESTREKDGKRQLIRKSDRFYFKRQYFYTKSHIYVLSAASRGNETEQMVRFFSSVKFNKSEEKQLDASKVKISSLLVSIPRIELKPVITSSSQTPSNPTVKNDNPTKLIVFCRPRPAYTERAKAKNIEGFITFRVTLGSDGFLSNIIVTSSIDDGLLMQAIYAAIRLKFLPEEKNGNAVTVARTIEYGFDIY